MDPFDDKDTISVPLSVAEGMAVLRERAVVALRMYRTAREFDLPATMARITIGSSPRCDVRLDDPYVSATHCLLERRPDDVMLVRDRRSKNGTYVNGNRVEAAELRPGGLLRVGRTTLVALGRHRREQLTAIEQLRGEDPGFRRAVDLAVKAAGANCNVLIVGETGTGKELVARAIHELSARAAGPFVAVNCGAIPRELIGSELFGHERGSFTGALSERDGLFAQADGGTLFLDELGELPLEMQPNLLRVLETRLVRRVGGARDTPVDVRVVAATNRLDRLGKEGSSLRVDLYHRVATVVVTLPPLRERPRDIPILVRAFMMDLAPVHGQRSINRTTLSALEQYPWPGNVRELRQSIERAMALCPHELTLDQLLPPLERRPPVERRIRLALPAREARRPALPAEAPDLTPLDRIVRDAMLDALERHQTIRAAAASLGMPKSTFADRAQRYGIPTTPKR